MITPHVALLRSTPVLSPAEALFPFALRTFCSLVSLLSRSTHMTFFIFSAILETSCVNPPKDVFLPTTSPLLPLTLTASPLARSLLIQLSPRTRRRPARVLERSSISRRCSAASLFPHSTHPCTFSALTLFLCGVFALFPDRASVPPRTPQV